MTKHLGWLLVVSLCTLGNGYGADWPHYRGPDGNGISPETGLNLNWAEREPQILWKMDMHDDGYAGPAVADGVLYIVDHIEDNDVVRAHDVATGELKWQFVYPAPGKKNYGFARATPAVDEGLVYTVSREGVVHCLRIDNGQPVWSRDVPKEAGSKLPSWAVAVSPVIDGDIVLVGAGGPGPYLVALNKKNGAPVASGGGTDQLGYSTPVKATINGKEQYLLFTGEGLVGVDPANFAALWKVEWKTRYDVNAADPLPVGPDRVFISSGYNRGCGVVQVRGNQAELVWENKEIQAHFSCGIVVDGMVYSTGDPGYLVCLNPQNGRAVWKEKGFQKGGLVGVQGHMIVADGAGGELTVVEINPREYVAKGSIKPLGGQTWTAPIVADKKLIVRNTKELAVLDLR
jgi:outer membrane protein assembly factor BamB